MEYNNTKRVFEKVTGILGIVAASICILVATILFIEGIVYLAGGFNYSYYDSFTNRWYYEDVSSAGVPILIWGLIILSNNILFLIFSIKLVKSPYLPNGEIVNRQYARVWLLVLSILMLNFVFMGLTITILCLKDCKKVAVQPAANVVTENQITQLNYTKNDYKTFYENIMEIKKLKSLGIIDETTFKKAITKIVNEIAK